MDQRLGGHPESVVARMGLSGQTGRTVRRGRLRGPRGRQCGRTAPGSGQARSSRSSSTRQPNSSESARVVRPGCGRSCHEQIGANVQISTGRARSGNRERQTARVRLTRGLMDWTVNKLVRSTGDRAACWFEQFRPPGLRPRGARRRCECGRQPCWRRDPWPGVRRARTRCRGCP